MPDPTEDTSLRLRGLTCRFGTVTAVDGVDLDIPPGQMVAIIGRSGAGKSTLMRLVNRLVPANAGSIHCGALDVTALRGAALRAWRRDCAMIFQQFNLIVRLDVLTNVLLGRLNRRPVLASLLGQFTEVERAQAVELLEAHGLLDVALQRAGTLSGGQQQRVAVARALVFEPRLILLDEPLGALDRQLREQMQYELKHLHQRLDITMVYVTHDQVEAMTMSDRVAVFSSGALRQVDEPRRLYEAPASLFVARFLGESNALPATVRRHDGGSCVAALASGEMVTALMPAPCAPGSPVHLVVRPEKILLGKAAQGSPNRFAARIAEVTFLGDQTRLRLVAFGADDFIVKLANTAGQDSFTPGTEIDIGWQAEDCRALSE